LIHKMADYFDIKNIDIEAPCEWGETASVECDIENEDSYDHLIWTVVRWRKSGSSDSWNTIYDDTDIIGSGDTIHINTSLVMPNYDVEVGFITYHYDGGWVPDDYELQHQPYLTEPTVTTQAASGIGNNSAYLNGYTQYKHDYIGFKWRVKGTGTWTYDWNSNSDSGGTGAWSHLITGLLGCATYEFYAYATNDDGTGNGTVREFTTTGTGPTVWTKNATGIADVDAYLVGQLLNDQGGIVDEYGFDYGLTDSYGYEATQSGSVPEGIDFMEHITSLNDDTTYHYRTKVHTACGWGYGQDKTFKTMPSAPVIDPKGYIWIDENDNCIHYISATEKHYALQGCTDDGDVNGEPGYIWIEGTSLHYIDNLGHEWHGVGSLGAASGANPGYPWIEGEELHYIDASGNERYFGL